MAAVASGRLRRLIAGAAWPCNYVMESNVAPKEEEARHWTQCATMRRDSVSAREAAQPDSNRTRTRAEIDLFARCIAPPVRRYVSQQTDVSV